MPGRWPAKVLRVADSLLPQQSLELGWQLSLGPFMAVMWSQHV